MCRIDDRLMTDYAIYLLKVSGLSLETSQYFQCHLVALGMISVCGGHAFFPKVMRSIVQKFIVQGLLLKDLKTDVEIARLEESERLRGMQLIGFLFG